MVSYRSSGEWTTSVRSWDAPLLASGLPPSPDIYGVLSRSPLSRDTSGPRLARENSLHFGQKRIPPGVWYQVRIPCCGTGQKYTSGSTSLSPTSFGRTGPSFDHCSPTRIFTVDPIILRICLESYIPSHLVPELPIGFRYPRIEPEPPVMGAVPRSIRGIRSSPRLPFRTKSGLIFPGAIAGCDSDGNALRLCVPYGPIRCLSHLGMKSA